MKVCLKDHSKRYLRVYLTDIVWLDTWNDEAVEAAYNKDTPAELMPLYVYCASKTMQEREYLKWVKENKPSFAASTVLPNLNVSLRSVQIVTRSC